MPGKLIINRCQKRKRQGQSGVVKAYIKHMQLELGHEAEYQKKNKGGKGISGEWDSKSKGKVMSK